MTVEEITLALKHMEDLEQKKAVGAYGVRLFLDNGRTVLVHEWTEDKLKDGLLGVVVHGRQALIAVRHIILVEMVPPPQ